MQKNSFYHLFWRICWFVEFVSQSLLILSEVEMLMHYLQLFLITAKHCA